MNSNGSKSILPRNMMSPSEQHLPVTRDAVVLRGLPKTAKEKQMNKLQQSVDK